MTRRTRGDDSNQKGAVLVETALTAPLFFLLIFGIIEFGFVFRDYVTVTAATNDAIRAASISGDDMNADFHILEVLVTSAAPLDDDSIQQIIVFRADGPRSVVPPACLLAPQDTASVKCNSYRPADFTSPVSDFGCDLSENLDEYWCPLSRNTSQATADFIGIHVVMERDLITGLFGSSKTITATEILRIEPRSL